MDMLRYNIMDNHKLKPQFYQNTIPVFDKTNTSLLLQNAFENVFFKVNSVVKLT